MKRSTTNIAVTSIKKHKKYSMAEHMKYEEIENESSGITLNNTLQDSNENITSRLADCLIAKEQFETLLKALKPSDIIMSYRKEIDVLAKECVAQNLKKIDKISTLIKLKPEYSDILKALKNNLLQKQQQFEGFISQIKLKFSECEEHYLNMKLHSRRLQDILEMAEDMKTSVENECNLFKRPFHAYGLKSDVLNNVSENDVTIISADCSYFLNIVIPLLIKYNFPDHLLISCEACEVLNFWLQNNLNSLFKPQKYNTEVYGKYPHSFYFKTEHELMADLSNHNEIFKENSVIILNLPLKRTLIADLLLCRLQDFIKKKQNSKLILLLSTYDDVSKYEKFFATVSKVSVLIAPNLIYPVQTIWKSSTMSPNDDFRDEIVCTVLAIHIFNDPGDILVLLPLLSDAKCVLIELNKNFKEFNFNDIDCVLLHENSSNESCIDILDKQKSSKRTIVIATDCAEMLVIPSVRYIVDCGLRKEYFFDSKKKLDVLKTTFISHAKAKVRKCLVGVFNPGFCYRLYNKNNFRKEMFHEEYPEVLTGNPISTMIKVFHYLSDTAAHNLFIDPIPEEMKKYAMEFLKQSNAVKNGKLTKLGKTIVKLPFPEKYSKLILKGIQMGLAYEAVVVVAFLSVQAKVFQHSDDENKQKIIDAVKHQLIQNDSDTLSYLYIFKLWLENNCSLSWCDDYYINSNTMDLVSSKVKEMCTIVNECLKESIVPKFSDDDCTLILREILFDCFQENLSVFTGHSKSGFRVLLSHCIAAVHSSSLLFEKENLPQFIIFDHMLCARRNFLVHITAVPESLVIEAITNGKIKYDFSEVFEKTLVQKVIKPVSVHKIKEVFFDEKCKKLKEVEDYIKKDICCESVIIEPLIEKEYISVYALKIHIDHVTDMIKKILSNNLDIFSNEGQTNVYELAKGEVKIPIKVKWVNGAKTISAKVSESCKMTVAQNSLNGSSYEREPFTVQNSINLTWVRRECNGYVSFNSSDFMKARSLALKSFPILGTEIFVKINERVQNQLLISDIPPETRQSVFENAFKELLPGVKFQEVKLIIQPPFETSENELKEIKAQIQEICEECIIHVFDIMVPKPKASATYMEAYINIYDDTDLTYAADMLSNILMGNSKVTAVPVYRSVIKFNLNLCKFLNSRFEKKCNELRKEFNNKYTDENIFSLDFIELNKEFALIKMISKYRDVIIKLRRAVTNLLQGDVLNKNNVETINKLFCRGGFVRLKSLEDTENVYIIKDDNSKTIRLYGSQVNCFCAKEHIMQFLKDAEREVVKCIELFSDNGDKRLLKKVILKYGVNLENFIECNKLRSAVLDFRSGSLLLHGCKDSIEKSEECLKEFTTAIDSIDKYIDQSSEICPFCSYPALNPTFRLEHCTHLYCYECIKSLIELAHFPIQCCAENCFKDIVLDDIWRILRDDKKQINILLEKSLKDYLEKNSPKIIICPVPDCNMFFHRNEIGSKLKCPLCENDICINCCVIYHQGYSCDKYQESKRDFDHLSESCEQNATLSKICPKCKSAFEKSDECKHVMCISCHAYFCWLCLREFPSLTEVENHQPYCSEYTL